MRKETLKEGANKIGVSAAPSNDNNVTKSNENIVAKRGFRKASARGEALLIVLGLCAIMYIAALADSNSNIKQPFFKGYDSSWADPAQQGSKDE